jgi:hypothetical protein
VNIGNERSFVERISKPFLVIGANVAHRTAKVCVNGSPGYAVRNVFCSVNVHQIIELRFVFWISDGKFRIVESKSDEREPTRRPAAISFVILDTLIVTAWMNGTNNAEALELPVIDGTSPKSHIDADGAGGRKETLRRLGGGASWVEARVVAFVLCFVGVDGAFRYLSRC